MDRLIAEIETEKKIEPEVKAEAHIEVKKQPKIEENPVAESYLNSFKNITLADVKREKEKKEKELFEAEKEVLIEQQYQTKEEVKPSQTIIEKPNYDLIEENPKIVKLKRKEKTIKKKSKKVAGLVLACVLGASATICIANTVILDNMSSSFSQLEDVYNINLQKYLNNIYNLDTTKKSMEMLETYPEDLLEAGDFGEKTNWFDTLCNFIGGIFGG
ncbi:MAG: hypothetical protein E7375_00255 [Clostridiales bacterium]|nr:hypothetical protein [Clostridiales bacterium]